jgi:chemotaxis family two-component system sensor kinase Cph1
MSNSHETDSGEGRIEREVELQATVKRLEAFCSQVAHDLRDALSGISSLAEIAYAALDEREDCGSALRSLALIAQQAHRSSKMLRGLLRLAQTRDAALQLGRVDVQVMAEQVAHEMTVCHGTHSMPHLCVRPMPMVAADADLLHAVLFNLINNAVKFTRERSDARIEIDATTSDEATVTVCVRDNGVGFDAARADVLFKPFSRLHGANYEGCGIGLSIVHHAVERLGGRVWADATPGQGARFFFTLPLGLADDGQLTHRDRQSDSTTPFPHGPERQRCPVQGQMCQGGPTAASR